jgi:DNA-binding CsgD family transcriptional regulator
MPARTSSYDHEPPRRAGVAASAASGECRVAPFPTTGHADLIDGRSPVPPLPDDVTLALVRRAATAVAGQDGSGICRAIVLALASGTGLSLSLIASDPGEPGGPVVAFVHPPALPAPGSGPVFAHLTSREREVAAYVASGRSNAEIAAALTVTVSTVKDHVHRILTKAGLPRRAAIGAAWHG